MPIIIVARWGQAQDKLIPIKWELSFIEISKTDGTKGDLEKNMMSAKVQILKKHGIKIRA